MGHSRIGRPAAHQGRAQKRGDSARICGDLERDFRSDRWRDGDRLPTERELCAHYKVARNTVRRALESLEQQKLIVRHVGRGTFKASLVEQMVADPFALDNIEAFSPADVMECRLIFEPGLVAHIVARATNADLERMTECLKQGEAATSLAEFERCDGEFHDSLAVATHNDVAISMSRSLAKVRRQARWGMLKARSMNPQRMEKVRSEHAAVLSALRNRDQRQAHALLRTHLLHVRAYMFEE
jgi:DNA-binding FadR family transcriptional regulator